MSETQPVIIRVNSDVGTLRVILPPEAYMPEELEDTTPFGRWGDHCPWGGEDWKQPHTQDCYDNGMER